MKLQTITERRLVRRGIAVFAIFAVGSLFVRGLGGTPELTTDTGETATFATVQRDGLAVEPGHSEAGHIATQPVDHPREHVNGSSGSRAHAAGHAHSGNHSRAHGVPHGHVAWYDELECYGPHPYASGQDHGGVNAGKHYRGGTNSTQDKPGCPVGVPRLGTYPCFDYTQAQVLKAIDIWEGTVRWFEDNLSTVVDGVRVWDQGALSTAMGYQTMVVPLNYMVHHAKSGSFNDPGTSTRDGKDVRLDRINSIIYGVTWEGYRPIGAMYVSSGESAWFEQRAPAQGPGGGQGGTPVTRGYNTRVFVRPSGEDPALWAKYRLADRDFWKDRKQHRHAAVRGIHGWAAMKAAGYNPVAVPETGTGCVLDWHAHLDAASSLTNSDMMHVWTVRAEEQHALSPATGSYEYGYPNGEFIESPLIGVDGRRLTYDYTACRRRLGAELDPGSFRLDHPVLGKVAQSAYARLGPDCRPYRYYFNRMGNPRTNRGYGPLGVYNPVSSIYGDDCRTGFPIPSSLGGALGGPSDESWDEQIRNFGDPQPCDAHGHH